MSKIGIAKAGVVACLAAIVLGMPGSGATAGGVKASTDSLLSQATYAGLESGRFMTKWVLLGPVPVGTDEATGKDEQQQKKAFGSDPFSTEQFQDKVKMGEKEYQWMAFASPGETVDRTAPLGAKSYVAAYAWACVNMAQESRAILGVGSDEGYERGRAPLYAGGKTAEGGDLPENSDRILPQDRPGGYSLHKG